MSLPEFEPVNENISNMDILGDSNDEVIKRIELGDLVPVSSITSVPDFGRIEGIIKQPAMNLLSPEISALPLITGKWFKAVSEEDI